MTSKHRYSVAEYIKGIEQGDVRMLSKAFTLLESELPTDQQIANELIKEVLPKTGNSLRIAVTGSPGVGKSTFIDTLGTLLARKGHKVAVLSIDPSSQHSGGSILGDKTRMEKLAREERAFIRPSASQLALGGAANATREGIFLCEAAGYDIIIIETVGVGQSETAAAQMTDVFLLLLEPGAGDDIQAIKKGIVEEADIIAITKADLDERKALQTTLAYLGELPTREWRQPELTISTLSEKDTDQVWKSVEDYISYAKINGLFDKKREEQKLFWLQETLKKRLLDDIYASREISFFMKELEKQILNKKMTAFEAANLIIERYKKA